MPLTAATRRRLRLILPIAATVAILAPLAWLWQSSLVPDAYSVMDMGYVDTGGGQPAEHTHHGTSVAELVADPKRPADVTVSLVAAQENLVVGGKAIAGYTLNGKSPGPTITARQGQLVEVHLHNASVGAGVALHWHGYDVPAAMDGVAGVTQDAVPVGGDFTYRFVAAQTGTYWYHSHQVANAQVIGGLFGALVVDPPAPGEEELGGPPSPAVDVLAVAHTYAAMKTLNGTTGDLRVPAAAGASVRVRVVNTDNGPIQAWASAPVTVVAIDGVDVNRPTDVTAQSVTVTGGGRVDIGVTMPADGTPVRVQVSKATAVILGSGDVAAPPQPGRQLDFLAYGSPHSIGFDPAHANRHFDYSVGRQAGFVRGVPGLWWSINGHLYPNVPMYVVREGDIVVMRVENHSGELHPMHLHGHHAVVLSRNGVAATGSPWWMDSLNVLNDESYEIAFVANNPGIWMDHCHNLKHAQQGMVAHLMYEGVTTPYAIGGEPDNEPE